LALVTRALQRKARLVAATFGGFESLRQAPFALPGAVAPNDEDLTGQAEELRRILNPWARGGNQIFDADSQLPRQAVTWSHDAPFSWLAIALAQSPARAFIAALTPIGASDRPRDLLLAARLIDAGRFAVDPCREETAANGTPALLHATEAADIWLQSLHARALAALTTDSPSPAHSDALRAIDRFLSAAPRHSRAQLRQLVAHCRGLVLAARGAGAELLLAEWASTLDAFALNAERVIALISSLEAYVTVTPRTSRTEARLVALLVLERSS
jgi:hypothetical protein